MVTSRPAAHVASSEVRTVYVAGKATGGGEGEGGGVGGGGYLATHWLPVHSQQYAHHGYRPGSLG